uniref:Uncharacterized protein n=1 Tax=Chromera velia CCMP2878 TaxID=1169474 RepID=A0A0G4HY85_9ALVE|eukprot:Cvel_9437.t1-p1 / transcript=Cvel_9437.t1 / gene=Cvel_9437 / organism=Chromera_velia_CCMP2878 / gene_product=hypothetical protein / transcript_product=hypothetical protein / location=Cvel_scaffold544:33681-33926(-) / protein_length=82 / sequence_SO=supercontig / SO=protein_coding / is_pseudo=false
MSSCSSPSSLEERRASTFQDVALRVGVEHVVDLKLCCAGLVLAGEAVVAQDVHRVEDSSLAFLSNGDQVPGMREKFVPLIFV